MAAALLPFIVPTLLPQIFGKSRLLKYALSKAERLVNKVSPDLLTIVKKGGELIEDIQRKDYAEFARDVVDMINIIDNKINPGNKEPGTFGKAAKSVLDVLSGMPAGQLDTTVPDPNTKVAEGMDDDDAYGEPIGGEPDGTTYGPPRIRDPYANRVKTRGSFMDRNRSRSRAGIRGKLNSRQSNRNPWDAGTATN